MIYSNKYVIITPTYNEADFIQRTIESVLKQTILPQEWIIVNDASTDNTEEIIKSYTEKYFWIKCIQKEKSQGPFGANVVEVFYYGFNKLSINDYDYIVKLDADIDLIRPDYFEYQLRKFHENKKLGISSGVTYYSKNGKNILVDHPDWRTTGALKMYRRECFQDIGGLVPILGWDGLDEYKAMFRGWQTRTFRDLKVEHLKRFVSVKRRNPEFYLKIGLSYYRRGYPQEFILLKYLLLLTQFKFEKGNNLLKSFYMAKKHKEKQYVTKEEKMFVRKFQIKRIFLHRIK